MSKLPLLAAMTLLVSGCAPDPDYLHVVQRVKSPDGLLTAAYVEDTQGGAMVGTSQDVYVFSGTGPGPTRYSDRVFSDECVVGVRISWLGPKELKVAYGARADHKTPRAPGPWWTFGHVPHGLMVHLAPYTAEGSYC